MAQSWGEIRAGFWLTLLILIALRASDISGRLGSKQAFLLNMAVNEDPLTANRLDSWKEIAAFFGRAERTVKRWESERGLPVHRVPGNGRSSVFAYPYELAEWLKGRPDDPETDPAENLPPDQQPSASSQTLRENPGPEASISDPAPAEAESQDGVSLPDETKASPHHRSFSLPLWLPAAVLVMVAIVFTVPRVASKFRAPAPPPKHTPSAEAQALYLKGRYFWNRRAPEDLNQAIDYFTQAIVKDPADAEAYVGLADCYNLLREFGAVPPAQAYTRALSAAQRAVELDNTSAEAHISLAFPTFWWEWKAATAQREFERALQLDPKLVRAHHWYATFLLGLHKNKEALAEINEAQRLDPASTTILADKGFILWAAGRHEESLALLKQLEASEPSLSSTHDYLGRIEWQQQNYAQALAEWRQLAELRHDSDDLEIVMAGEKGLANGGLRGLYESELPVEKNIVDRGTGSAYLLAASYAALGRKREALAALKISFQRHESGILLAEPPIPELNSDPEYQELRAEVGRLLAR